MNSDESPLNRSAGPGVSNLSARQRECLQGVLALKPAKRIAHDLGITPSAVEKHLRHARDKLGVASTAEAAQIFAGKGGEEIPHCGNSYLAQFGSATETGAVLHSMTAEQPSRVEDANHGDFPPEHALTPLQTMITIVAMSIASIVGLLLLISCARAIESIVSG